MYSLPSSMFKLTIHGIQGFLTKINVGRPHSRYRTPHRHHLYKLKENKPSMKTYIQWNKLLQLPARSIISISDPLDSSLEFSSSTVVFNSSSNWANGRLRILILSSTPLIYPKCLAGAVLSDLISMVCDEFIKNIFYSRLDLTINAVL